MKNVKVVLLVFLAFFLYGLALFLGQTYLPQIKAESRENIVQFDTNFPSDLAIQVDSRIFMTITSEGKIIFNTKDFPDYTPTDFARKFVFALEKEISQTICPSKNKNGDR